MARNITRRSVLAGIGKTLLVAGASAAVASPAILEVLTKAPDQARPYVSKAFSEVGIYTFHSEHWPHDRAMWARRDPGQPGVAIAHGADEPTEFRLTDREFDEATAHHRVFDYLGWEV